MYVSLEPESMSEVAISTELGAVKITVCIGEGNPITWVLSLSGAILDEVLLQLLLSRETAKRFF